MCVIILSKVDGCWWFDDDQAEQLTLSSPTVAGTA
jgi:hypothetical protein